MTLPTVLVSTLPVLEATGPLNAGDQQYASTSMETQGRQIPTAARTRQRNAVTCRTVRQPGSPGPLLGTAEGTRVKHPAP